MENENILYVDCLDSYMDIMKYSIPKCLKFIMYKFLGYIGKVRKEGNYFCLYSEKGYDINERMLRKISDTMNEKKINTIICANDLYLNEKIRKWLADGNYNVLDGSWLMNFLMYDILEKIAYIKNIKVDTIEVSVFIKCFSDYHIESIKMIAKKCKVINIVTDNVKKFEQLEKILLEESGIMINITGNVEKSSKRADVIFNFDFMKNELDKCKMKRNSILVQMNQEKYIRKDGIVIRRCKLELPIKYDDIFAKFEHFNKEILYEGILYYKNSFNDIMKILRRDNVNIKYFIGNNGKISFREFLDQNS